MSKHLRTERGLFGQYITYKDGEKVGEAWPGLFEETYNLYNKDGTYSGHTTSGIFADNVIYNASNDCVATTNKNIFGSQNIYNSDGDHIGTTITGMFGYDTELNEGGDEAALFSDGFDDY